MATSEGVRVPRLLTVKQLADATGIPVWRIHELCAQKKLPHLRVGKTIRFSETAVIECIESNTH